MFFYCIAKVFEFLKNALAPVPSVILIRWYSRVRWVMGSIMVIFILFGIKIFNGVLKEYRLVMWSFLLSATSSVTNLVIVMCSYPMLRFFRVFSSILQSFHDGVNGVTKAVHRNYQQKWLRYNKWNTKNN